MISAAVRQKIIDQQTAVYAAYNAIQPALDNRDNYQAVVNELNRQIQYHLSRGDVANANIVSGQMPPAKSSLDAAVVAYNSALAAYKTELGKYKSLLATLSPDDRAAQEKLDANDPALASTGNVNTAPTSNASGGAPAAGVDDKVNYAQKNTKYLIIAGVVIVVVVAVFIFRKRFA